jgi:pimeloyl-ACP methyl ester carboxylesterase
MTKRNGVLLILAFSCIAIAAWQIAAAQKGLEVVNLHTSTPPVTIISPADSSSAPRPTILIGHGFAGSSVLMRGFALTLAHAGYSTVSWDFEGHGANPNPFNLTSQSNDLLRDAETALAEAETTGLIDAQHVAILGHSMGSGVTLLYGVTHPDTSATIAISPMNQSVSLDLPQNLLLMAGSLESQFVVNAEELLIMAGGQRDDLAGGHARELVIIPDVEHISILFSPTAHSTARSWLDGTFGQQAGAVNYIDLRILWLGLGIFGFILLSNGILNSISATSVTKKFSIPVWLRLLGLLGGGVIATLILYLVSLLGVKISQLFGLVVGGYILVWFGLAGVASLIMIRPRISKPTSKAVLKGMIGFSALWLGVGLLGNFVWLPWLLIPARLWLWIPGAIIVLPWFLSVGETSKQANTIGQIGWWLVQVIAVMGGLYLALRVNPELGFLFLILPLVPIMLGLNMLVISAKHGSWAYAVPGAMFTSWLLLAVFPLL